MPRDSAAADRPASYLVGTAAAFPLFFRDRTKPINQLPFSPSAKFPKSGSSCESRGKPGGRRFAAPRVARDRTPWPAGRDGAALCAAQATATVELRRAGLSPRGFGLVS